MNTSILADFQALINWQIPQQQALLECLFKAEAMLAVMLAPDLQVHPR